VGFAPLSWCPGRGHDSGTTASRAPPQKKKALLTEGQSSAAALVHLSLKLSLSPGRHPPPPSLAAAVCSPGRPGDPSPSIACRHQRRPTCRMSSRSRVCWAQHGDAPWQCPTREPERCQPGMARAQCCRAQSPLQPSSSPGTSALERSWSGPVSAPPFPTHLHPPARNRAAAARAAASEGIYSSLSKHGGS